MMGWALTFMLALMAQMQPLLEQIQPAIDVANWYDPVYRFFVPLNPFGVTLGVVAVAGIIYFILNVTRRRQIFPDSIGEYIFTVVRPNEKPVYVRATAAPYHEPVEIRNIEELKSREETIHFAETFERLSGKAFFYLLQYHTGDGLTKQRGIAMLATNVKLEDSRYYGQRSEYWSTLQARNLTVRIMRQATVNGRLLPKEWPFRGKMIDFLWYPVDTIENGKSEAEYTAELFSRIQATMQMAADAQPLITVLKKDNYYRRGMVAATKNVQRLESELHKAREEIRFYRRQWANKDYWPALLNALSSGMSPMLVFLICGGTFLMAPEIIARQTLDPATGAPIYTPQQYNVMAIGLAGMFLGLIWLIRGRNKTS